MGSQLTRRPATVPVSAIVPSRFGRAHREDPAFAMLVRSIKRTNGPLQRVVVRARSGGKYELVCGHRRWRAAKKAKQARIAADVVPLDDREAVTWLLAENALREDLDPITQAELFWRAAAVLGEDGLGGRPPTLTGRKAGLLLAEHTGLAPDTVRKMLGVLPDDPALRDALRRRDLDVEKIRLAQAIARLGRQHPEQTERWWVQIALRVAEQGWTVADLRGARDALKQHDKSDLERVKDKIKALARGDVRPKELHEFRDLSAGFRLRHRCPRCGLEFD